LPAPGGPRKMALRELVERSYEANPRRYLSAVLSSPSGLAFGCALGAIDIQFGTHVTTFNKRANRGTWISGCRLSANPVASKACWWWWWTKSGAVLREEPQ